MYTRGEREPDYTIPVNWNSLRSASVGRRLHVQIYPLLLVTAPDSSEYSCYSLAGEPFLLGYLNMRCWKRFIVRTIACGNLNDRWKNLGYKWYRCSRCCTSIAIPLIFKSSNSVLDILNLPNFVILKFFNSGDLTFANFQFLSHLRLLFQT